MSRLISESEFTLYILSMFSIGEKKLDRLLDEFNEFYGIETDEFIKLRHQELKKE